jgi:hypothetical protein
MTSSVVKQMVSPSINYKGSRESKKSKSYSSYRTFHLSRSSQAERIEGSCDGRISIMKNDVSEIVPQWIYKIKHAVDRSIDKYKAVFVARGFSRQEREDYDEMFAPVARYTSIRSIISLAASMG